MEHPDLDQMQDQEDRDYQAMIKHNDYICPLCGALPLEDQCDCDPGCECVYTCSAGCGKYTSKGFNDLDWCDHCGKYTMLPINSSWDRACENCGHHE